MNDPFDMLRTDLVDAATRAQLVSPDRRWAWLRGRSHPLVVVAAALVVCGGAAAAVVSLTASSQPLSGRVPGRVAPVRPGAPISVAGYRYSIRVTPSLSSGSSGWEVWTAYKAPPFTGGLGGGGGGGYPTRTIPIFQGGGVEPWSIPTGAQIKGDSVGFVVTGPQVAAVRIGDRTIRTFSSSQLPAGDRAAVFFLAARTPTPVVGWRPGQPIDSRMRTPAPGSRPHSTLIRTTAVLPLDFAGDVLATAPAGPEQGYVRGWSFWQAPSAVTSHNHQPRYRGRTHPRPGICGLTEHGLPGLTPEWGSTITSLPTVKDYVGELFVSCVSTVYYLHGWPMTAAILLDARRPGVALGPIPGAAPVPGHLDLIDSPGASLSARRVGNAWLVIQGGSGSKQRLRVLDALQLKLDRRHLTP
jgi:hypothetical protein